jgi:hypothetical protein
MDNFYASELLLCTLTGNFEERSSRTLFAGSSAVHAPSSDAVLNGFFIGAPPGHIIV